MQFERLLGRTIRSTPLRKWAIPSAVVGVVWLHALPCLEPLEAQSLEPLTEAVRAGGAWVNIPVRTGRGSVETATLPTFGLEIAGCATIWSGHSGSWSVRAEDLVSDSTLTAFVEPGEPVRFRHRTGMRTKLSVEVRWSEPRDTTLFIWVGLGREENRPDATCAPPPDAGPDSGGDR